MLKVERFMSICLAILFSQIEATAFIMSRSLMKHTHFAPVEVGKQCSNIFCSPKVHVIVSSAKWEDEDDFTERSVSVLTKISKGLNKELPVPVFLVPARVNEGNVKTTTLQGWFLLSVGLALMIGNPVYPTALIAFLYLSRSVDAPDVAAAAAAVVTAGVLSPLLENLADATGLDDSFLARLPVFLGLTSTAFVLGSILQESQQVFVKEPRQQEKERIPALKNERDLRFFDVKMKNKESGVESDVSVEVEEKKKKRSGSE